MECHYRALGLEPGASQEEIRGAYRRMALKHHPDKCGGDTEMFLKVSQAYQILSTCRGPSEPHNFEALNRILRMFLNVAARTCREPEQAEPTRVPIRVTLEDLYHHKIKRVAIKRRSPGGWDTKSFYVSLLNHKPCYVFIGEGDATQRGRNDLVLDLKVAEHPDIKIDSVCQFDLYVERKITLYEYYYGTSTTVDHLSGERLCCSKSFSDGSMIHRFAGMGLPRYDESSSTLSRGDLLVFYRLWFPPHSAIDPLDEKTREFMASVFGKQQG